MKIALPTNGNLVDDHFGHCEGFTVFGVNEDNEIVSRETVSSAAVCGCKSNIGATLADMGVTVMLAGNMGPGAVRALGMHGIEVLRGVSGDVRSVTEEWLAGAVEDSGVECGGGHGEGHNCAH